MPDNFSNGIPGTGLDQLWSVEVPLAGEAVSGVNITNNGLFSGDWNNGVSKSYIEFINGNIPTLSPSNTGGPNILIDSNDSNNNKFYHMIYQCLSIMLDPEKIYICRYYSK